MLSQSRMLSFQGFSSTQWRLLVNVNCSIDKGHGQIPVQAVTAMLGSQFLPVPPKPCLSKSGPSCLGMALGSYTGANPTRCRFRLRNEIDAQGVTVGQYLEQHLRNG